MFHCETIDKYGFVFQVCSCSSKQQDWSFFSNEVPDREILINILGIIGKRWLKGCFV